MDEQLEILIRSALIKADEEWRDYLKIDPHHKFKIKEDFIVDRIIKIIKNYDSNKNNKED